MDDAHPHGGLPKAAQALMRGGGRWRSELGRAADQATQEGQEVEVACTSSIWTDVAGAQPLCSDPPYGRYFLPLGCQS